MESTTVSTTSPSRSDPQDIDHKKARLALVLLTAFFALLLIFKMDAVAGGADSSGYLNHAKQIASGRVHEPMRMIGDASPSSNPELSPFTYVPLGYVPSGTDQMVPTYPVGLSLLTAGVAIITGWNASAGVTMGLHALAGPLLIYALARCLGLTRRWSLVGVILSALCPLYVMYSLQLMSDLPSLVWCAATILFAWQSRTRRVWALAAGVAFAAAVLIRPTNALLIFAIALALGFSWRNWLLFGLAGLPGAIFWAAYNQAAYGHPFASGYGNVLEIMGWPHFLGSWRHYLLWLPALLTPFAILLFAFPRLLISSPRVGWMLFLWWGSFATFYAFYPFTQETWWYLRFILPAFPSFILTILTVASQLADRRNAAPFRFDNKRSQVLTTVLLAVILVSNIYWNRKLYTLHQRDRIHYAAACAWMREHLPENAIVLTMQTSGALFFYTDFTLVRWDTLAEGGLTKIETAARHTGQPIYAATFPFEADETPGANSLINKFPGWEKLTVIGQTTIWKRTGSTPTLALSTR